MGEGQQEKPVRRSNKRRLLLFGVGAACLAGYGLLSANDPVSSGSSGGVAAIFGLGRNAAEVCRALASQPIEAGQNQYGEPNGVSLPTMLGPPAVEACSAAVEDNPNDAESWRRLGRAHIASASFFGADQTLSSQMAKEAFIRAAELGDIPAGVIALTMRFDGSETHQQVIDKGQKLALAIKNNGQLDAKEQFYKAVLTTVLMESEAFYDARRKTNDPYLMGGLRDDYKRENKGEAAALFAQALQSGGGMPFFKESWDLELLGVCSSYEYVCKLAGDAGTATNDPRLFLGISAAYLQEAYRIMDLQYRLAGNDEQAILSARNTGLSLASVSNLYTSLAEQHGGGKYNASIERLRLAHRTFRDQALDRYNQLDAAASQARSEAWTALAAVVVANALTPDGDTVTADHDQSVAEYLQRMEQIRCQSAADAVGYANGSSAAALARYSEGC